MYEVTTSTTTNHMTPKYQVLESLDQLISLVSGRDPAIKTNHLEGKPLDRIRAITSVIAEELSTATQQDDTRSLKQCKRKIESLTSLKTLATVLMDEVEWD